MPACLHCASAHLSRYSEALALFGKTRSLTVKERVIGLVAVIAETCGKVLLKVRVCEVDWALKLLLICSQLNVLEPLKLALVPTQSIACRQAGSPHYYDDGQPLSSG